ncbi:DNA-binding transcriptional LysR family regulator [Pseudochelatococcus lubricantis]|uniref:DNA-binding transcriptional LysR family regulator n=1 Tax=Pseudochelatococcus lubricantis TaxID=1538102 RepID=A0ABX0V170_9HYPH|nr:LysR substrate-binding domain-containing protein [Pseudochelatococcus lubricantis]NIJ57930.1 DNA-binding transcriptional LysR family regulator [Pseudochelatococcus lubricantis]
MTKAHPMNFAQLRAFHAVAVTGTFSGAAQVLGVSQPAITQHIKSLEESVGARLFVRSGGAIELTANAMHLLPKVRDVMLTIEDIEASVESGRSLRLGYLTLGVCSPCMAMPILERFLTQLPGVHIEIRLENSNRLLDLVASSRADVALVTLTEPHPAFMCRYLVDQEVLLLVNEGHPWWERESVSIGELGGQRFILREEGSMTRHLFERALSEASQAVSPYLVLGSREAVKEAAAAGLGVGIVLSRELGFDSRLRGIPLDGVGFAAGEYAVALPRFGEKGAIREFMNVASAVMAG